MLPVVTALFVVLMVLIFAGFYVQGLYWLAIMGLLLFVVLLVFTLSKAGILRA